MRTTCMCPSVNGGETNRDLRVVGLLASAWLAMATMACGSATMLAENGQAVDLNGRWILDRQASEDVRARLTPLLEKSEKQSRKAERRFEELESGRGSPRNDSSSGGTEVSVQAQAIANMRWLQAQRQKESLRLLDAMLPASELTITQSSNQLKFASNKGEGTRTFVAGEASALFSELGGFEIKSGWDKQAFVIQSRGTDNGIAKTEHYSIADGGTRLEERLQVKLPGIGKQSFRIIYKRD